MSGGVPKRILITQTQRNTPSKAGNPVPKKAIIACSGEKSRTAICNYIRKRTNVFPLPTSYSWSTQMTAADVAAFPAPIEIAGFSSITAGGVTVAGSLNPPAPSWTEILSIYTFDYPVSNIPPPQLIVHLAGVHIPTSITFSGVFKDGSHHTFTLRIDEAHYTGSDYWVWLNTQVFAIGNTYSLSFN